MHQARRASNNRSSRPRTSLEKKRNPRGFTDVSSNLQIGDRLTDETGEYLIASRP